MSCVNCPPLIEKYGADPANIQWTVVRGDSSTLEVQFLEDDEVTFIDTDGWTSSSTAYNITNQTPYSLITTVVDGICYITAPSDITSQWGTGSSSIVEELSFDLQIVKEDQVIWTPVIGTICVLGDITGGSL